MELTKQPISDEHFERAKYVERVRLFIKNHNEQS